MLLIDGEWLAFGQWRFRATTRTAAATATGHCPESLEGRVEAWRSVDAATGRSEKVNIPVPPNRETCLRVNRVRRVMLRKSVAIRYGIRPSQLLSSSLS